MNAYAGLLSAIRDQPDSDEPRLILADWLEDHGEPDRAEFLRVQCVLARLPAYHDLRPELEARERGLLLLHETVWTGLPEQVNAAGTLRRGFLEKLAVPASLLLRSPDVFLGGGLVRDLEVAVDDLPEIERLAELPHLHSVTRLRLAGTQLHRAGLAALLDSPHLRQLTALALSFASISRSGLRRLSGAARELREIDLAQCNIFPDDLAALLPTGSSHLERLVLDGTWPGSAGGETLARCPHLEHLRDLSLHGLRTGVDGLAALAQAPFAAGLEKLDLGGNGDLGDPAGWLRGDLFRSLLRLDLRGSPLVWEDLSSRPPARHSTLRELLLSWPAFLPDGLADWLGTAMPALELLDLQSDSPQRLVVPSTLLDTLTAAPGLARLRRLRLQATLMAVDFARLLAGPNAARWRSLEVVRSRLAEGLRPLVASRLQPALSRLVLTHCDLGDEDAAELAHCEWLSDLRELGLSGNRLRDRAAAVLARSPYLKRLVALDLSCNDITDVTPFAGTYLANPAILNLADNPLFSGEEDLLLSGAEIMRRVTVAPILALLAESEADSNAQRR